MATSERSEAVIYVTQLVMSNCREAGLYGPVEYIDTDGSHACSKVNIDTDQCVFPQGLPS